MPFDVWLVEGFLVTEKPTAFSDFNDQLSNTLICRGNNRISFYTGPLNDP